MSEDLVLVTGGSGFIGSHCILSLLEAGYRVRTTVRDLKREPQVRAMLKRGGAEPGDRLSFAAADLMSDDGWQQAVAGCTYVLHVASPLPPSAPKHEDELITPAREGTLRVLRAARDAGVKRVVLTSSFAAIGYGHEERSAPFTEADWTNLPGGDVTAYPKSKTLAERAAWDFMTSEGNQLELSVINPVGVFGPVLGPDYSASILIVQRLMDGALPGCPKLYFGAVDVRDVADLHLIAMTHPAAKGERFLAVAGEFLAFQQIAKILKAHLGSAAKRVPTRELPNWMIHLASLRDPAVKLILPELGKKKSATNEKATRLLGWAPRSNEEAILATAQSLLDLGLLKESAKTKQLAAPAGALSQAAPPKHMKMTGNTILITGGASGIGQALAQAFHAEGNQVIIAGRRQSLLDETVNANPGMKAVALDINDASAIKSFASRVKAEFPALNVVIHNAGVMREESILEGGTADAEEIITTNLLGPIRLTEALLPQLLAQPSSVIMTVSSGLAFVPMATTPTYSATKAAIHSWTQSLRYQLKDTSIEVLELIPPYVQTELSGPAQAQDPAAMPLKAFIAETMKILKRRPEEQEILVRRVMPLRYAEAKGGYERFFLNLNDRVSAARAERSRKKE